jgi:hypothetical protein
LALSVLGNYLFLGSLAAVLLGGGKIFGAMILAIFNQEEAQKEIDKASTAMGLGALLGITIGLLADFTSGANSKLSPTELDVTLTRTDGNPQPDNVFMDSGEFQNIKWIRIRLSPRETEVLSLDCVD